MMERRMERRERERERSRTNLNEPRVDLDSRTPLAWQHRDFNYQQSAFNERYPEGAASSNSDRFSHPSLGSRSARSGPRKSESEMSARGASKTTSSSAGNHRASGGGHPSSQETTTGGSSSETETDSHADRGPPTSTSRPGTSGTLRSLQSVPLLGPLQGPFNPLLGGGVYGMVGHMLPPPTTWNGEPCPVHGAASLLAHQQLPPPHPMAMAAYPGYPPMYSSMSMRRAASIHELALAAGTPMPALMPPPPGMYPPPTPDGRSFLMMAAHHGPSSMIAGPTSTISHQVHHHHHGGRMRMRSSGPGSLPPMPPPSLLPPMQRRPVVLNGKNGHPEPLPVREAPPLPPKVPPSDAASKAASKSSSKTFSYSSCCQGSVVVLWVILSIIGFGIVMAVVFYYAFK